MPIIATCTRGIVVDRRPLPSLVQMQMLPVSATPKFTPLMPRSAAEELGPQRPSRELRHARTSATSSSVAPSRLLNSSATSPFVLWMIGMTMCDG